jgi:hypothetical protein
LAHFRLDAARGVKAKAVEELRTATRLAQELQTSSGRDEGTIPLTKQIGNPDNASERDGGSRIEVTKEMIDAGAKTLDDQLFKLNPFGERVPIHALKVIIPKVYRSMAALALK